MKTTEEIKQASDKLKEQIKSLVDEFVKENGDCNVNISSNANRITVMGGRRVFTGHDIEVTVTI